MGVRRNTDSADSNCSDTSGIGNCQAAIESSDVDNTSVSDRPKNRNISKSFAVSEFNSKPPNSAMPTTNSQNQSPRINPLGCRFFDVPSMRQ